MNRLFNQVPNGRIKKNVFDLTHDKKLSMNMGILVPTFWAEVVPGDRFKVSMEQLIRMSPLTAPIMHRINVYTYSYFVPLRILHNTFEDFITGGKDGSLNPAPPVVVVDDATSVWMQKGSLADYLGIPPPPAVVAVGSQHQLSAYPFLAYQQIYNDYFRDQTLEDEIVWDKDEADQSALAGAVLSLRNKAWEKDYFTSALPWAQRGGDIMLPTTFQINEADISWRTPANFTNDTGLFTGDATLGHQAGDVTNALSLKGTEGYQAQGIKNIDSISTSGGTASTGSLNDLRTAMRVQEWLEKNARGGARYIEQIWSHFKKKSSDSRLQRAEFLGGGINPVTISEVLSTFGVVDNPQGNMSGHGISVGHDAHFNREFEEHGIVMTMMCIMPRTGYQQGIPRSFLRFDKYDYYWPEFAHLGEQEVKNKELYVDYTTDDIAESVPFGYQSRYADMKFMPNSVHGDFRDDLEHWHCNRKFDTRPALNAEFVRANPTQRIFAVDDPTIDKLYVQILNKVTAIRPMPKFGVPHF